MSERERLDQRRKNRRFEVRLNGASVFVELGLHEDGRVGEVFVNVAKIGSDLRTSIEAWAMAISKSIQFGMPAHEVVRTFRGTRCYPCGHISDAAPETGLVGEYVTSIYDLVARLLEAVVTPTGHLRDVEA